MSDLFPKTGVLKRGYEQKSVGEFFQLAKHAYEAEDAYPDFTHESIHNASFPVKFGGFDTKAVDNALGRLEAAFIQRDRSNFISQFGESEWYERVSAQATALYPRLSRPYGQRFRHPEDGGRGYSVAQVDALMDRLASFFDDVGIITEPDLRYALFKSAKGEAAYDEAQVDAYIGHAMYVLLAVS